uniref:Secreted protein n=1 Tax=Rhipicephalus appendiculatus TaxID=34631 RepID=A0A131YDT4_RHIAP
MCSFVLLFLCELQGQKYSFVSAKIDSRCGCVCVNYVRLVSPRDVDLSTEEKMHLLSGLWNGSTKAYVTASAVRFFEGPRLFTTAQRRLWRSSWSLL